MLRPRFDIAILDKFIVISFLLTVALGTVLVSFPEGASAILVVLILTGVCLYVFRLYTVDKDFITRLFLLALACRLAFGIFVHIFDFREFFGGDANTYNKHASVMVDMWLGQSNAYETEIYMATSTLRVGWGMNYLVGILYLLLGKNMFAAQSFCAVIGAATAPMVYYCANEIFDNRRVARYAAAAAGFFPALIIWSGQLLKDGLIIFLLVLAMTMVIQLQKRFNIFSLLLLSFSLFSILSLRFYIFYMVVVAVVGSFAVGVSKSNKSIIARIAVLAVLGFALTYFGVIRLATSDLDTFTDLKMVQSSRLDLSRAGSGFGTEADVSTAEGAITTIPIGLVFLMLAPFPWQATNLRQAITIPEVLLWWAMIPTIISGVWFAARHRLRNALPVLIFTLMLMLAYSIFQGNVGTAYRQRTQIQVFLCIFFAVGLVVRSEKRRDAADATAAARARVDAEMRARSELRNTN